MLVSQALRSRKKPVSLRIGHFLVLMNAPMQVESSKRKWVKLLEKWNLKRYEFDDLERRYQTMILSAKQMHLRQALYRWC